MGLLNSIVAAVVVFSIPVYAGFNIQKLLALPMLEPGQQPNAPGQQVAAIQVDSQGNFIVVTTVTDSVPPGTTLPFTPYAIAYKLDPNGNQLFARVLPGVAIGSLGFLNVETGVLLAIDANNDIYLGGETMSPESFPFTTLISSSTTEGFVMKLRGADGTIAYASQIWVPPSALTVDSSGQALIAMVAGSNVPVSAGAYTSPAIGVSTAQTYFGRLSPAGDQFIFTARYGGTTSVCQALGSPCSGPQPTTPPIQIMLDARGDIWIVGETNTVDLPVTSNALKSQCGCADFTNDIYLAEFSADGSHLLYGTYFGSSATSFVASDGNNAVNSAAMDGSGNIWMVGNTNGVSFPVTPNALQSTLQANPNGFISEYNPASNELLFSSYFGGSSPTGILAGNILQVQTGAGGSVVFAGNIGSGSLQPAPSGFASGSLFLATIDPHTYAISLTTFPTGSLGTGLSFTSSGSVAVTGISNVVEIVNVNADSATSSLPSIYGIANSAGGSVTGAIAPAELVTLYGANLGPATPVTADLSAGTAPTQLGGLQVLINGSAVPLLYASSQQINAIAPANLASSTFTVVLSNSGTNSNQAVVDDIPASPAAFNIGTATAPITAAINQDGTVNGPNNPARPGSIVSVYGTGFGLFTTGVPVQVYYMGAGIENLIPFVNQSLEVTYAGQAPGLVTGVAQINFQLPLSVAASGPPGPQFRFDVGGWLSPVFSLSVGQ
jgi:uncharacterized protein (TIGR03437 family)